MVEAVWNRSPGGEQHEEKAFADEGENNAPAGEVELQQVEVVEEVIVVV